MARAVPLPNAKWNNASRPVSQTEQIHSLSAKVTWR